jgi:hypothetical protein
MTESTIRILVETTPKRTYASALDWPGLARAGRDEVAALAAVGAALPRYRAVLAEAGLDVPAGDAALVVAERCEGDASTAFGIPAMVADADRRPLDAAEAAGIAAIVAAGWQAFDRIAAAAPEELRKGPRGGGRDTSKVVEHVWGGDDAYASVMGVKVRGMAGQALREAMLAALAQPSDGSPMGGKRWPPRYAARRIAWHALDHAWEIEDRSTPG